MILSEIAAEVCMVRSWLRLTAEGISLTFDASLCAPTGQPFGLPPPRSARCAHDFGYPPKVSRALLTLRCAPRRVSPLAFRRREAHGALVTSAIRRRYLAPL
ncbi:MAG: hypothetical protein KBS47_02550 [Bacteroidales bacterium]|nr:hypothetical protein [Candidatus Equimonas enterica]